MVQKLSTCDGLPKAVPCVECLMVLQVLLVEQGRVDPLRGTANARPQQVRSYCFSCSLASKPLNRLQKAVMLPAFLMLQGTWQTDTV